MSKWPGKYVIGLTGNIATGKSVVRRMLEHLGAYSIDADALSHRAIAKGAPGYKPVIESFGRFILDETGEIDRSKLGRMVFTNPEALKTLESIVHPLVEQAVDIMVRRATQPVIVIEAIKLLEGKLVTACDIVWVTYAPEELQEKRLVHKRGMSVPEARQRINAQPPQETKTEAANIIIQNIGSFEDTWKQVVTAWNVIAPKPEPAPVEKKPAAGEFIVQRGRLTDSARIAKLISVLSSGEQKPTEDEIMEKFGEMAFLMLLSDGKPVGVAGWQVENLVARTTELYLQSDLPMQQAVKSLVTELERASTDLQCEASLVFLPVKMSSHEETWKELGYSRRTADTLGVQAWQDAAIESQPPNTYLLFKQLRKDRVLRPI